MARPAWTAQCTDRKLVGELLPVRRRESHKGDYGRVLLLCGSEGLTGAARLAAKAALRAGSGLVYLGVPEKIYPIIAAGAGSEIVFPLPCDEAGRLCMASLPAITERLSEMDAVLLGPGLGRSEELKRLVQALLSICRVPLVLDADALNEMAEKKELLSLLPKDTILTPHLGEMSRLTGKSVPEIQKQLFEVAEVFARQYNIVCVLKDEHTVTACPDGTAYLNLSGNHGMATAGSGDVLSGILGSLLAQGMETCMAAPFGVFLHGVSGDEIRGQVGSYGMMASDLIEGIRITTKKLEK